MGELLETQICPSAIQEADDFGWIPLHYAAYMGSVQVVELFLENNNSTAYEKDRDRTALHLAVENGRRNVVKLFLQELAFRDLINEHDNEGNTAFHLAAIKGHYALLMMLADDRRVDRMAINTVGMTTIDIVQSDKRLMSYEKVSLLMILI